MRGTTPIIVCDGLDGSCGNWDIDYYESSATTVGGVRVTETQRAPLWVNSDLGDFCPAHQHETKDGAS